MVRAAKQFISLVLWLCLAALGLGVALGGVWYTQRHDHLRALAQRALAEKWPHLRVHLRAARILDPGSLELRGLTLSEPHHEGGRTMATVDEILARCNLRMTDVMRGQLSIKAVTLRRLKLHVERSPGGGWPLTRFLPCGTTLDEPLIVSLENGTGELVDSSRTKPSTLVFRDVQGMFQILGGATGSQCRGQITLHGEHWKLATALVSWHSGRDWEIETKVTDLNFSSELIDQVPLELAAWLQAYATLEATACLNLHVVQKPHVPRTVLRATGELKNGRFFDPRLAFPITELHGQFQFADQELKFPKVTARYGAARIECSGSCHPMVVDGLVVCHGWIENLHVDPSLWRHVPPQLAEVCQSFQPLGHLDARFTISRIDGVWQPRFEIECQGMSLTWSRFPVPFEQVHGQITLQRSLVAFELQGQGNNQPVRVWGQIENPGKGWTGWCEYRAEKFVALDERIVAALPARSQAALRDFSPRGEFTVVGRAERRQPGQPTHFHSWIRTRQATIRHKAFPYPLHDVSGVVEQDGNVWRFSSFQGQNDGGRFEGYGTWTSYPNRGGQLQLRVTGANVPLELELRSALPPTAQAIWDQLAPEGQIDAIDVHYSMDSQSGQRATLVELRKSRVSPAGSRTDLTLIPVLFPYRLDEVTGRASYRDGKVTINEFRARHGRVIFSGEAVGSTEPDGRFQLQLHDLLIDRCRPDREFLAALPPRLGALLKQLEVDGESTIQGSLSFAGTWADPSAARVSWDLRMDLDDARADIGIPLQHVCGDAHLVGTADKERVQCRGQVDFDSLLARGLHCTGVRGPLWLDDQRLLLGAWAHAAEPQAPGMQLTANALQGRLMLNLEARLTGERLVTLEGQAERIDLARVAQEFGRRDRLYRGKASANFRLAGRANEVYSWHGYGRIQLRETNLYELPVFLALLKQVRTGSRDRAAFDESDIAFRLRGNHIYFDQLDLMGDALTLKGVGEMNLRRELNLSFYTMIGREESYLPAIRPLLGLASQRFLLVRVQGTLEDPRTSREVLPGVNETLAQLFPDLQPSHSAAPGAPDPIRAVSGP